MAYGGNSLMHVLPYLYSTKYNEITVCHLDVQKHVSYKEVYEQFKYFVYKVHTKGF